MTTRRGFIKSGCVACLLAASGASLLEGCATPLPMLKVASKSNELVVDPASFISERGNMLVVRTSQLEHDILLIKDGDNYRALYLRCTHEGVDLTATKNKIYCSSHGSVFDLEGKVLKEPALRPLKTFKTQLNNNQIIINLT
ncbi:Rieske (2Fe-2S) protein [Mucilaginibacter limnophilus]|uniref:Rieske (2Fe-2S) protein n=1 Tax=Mucilaginibacter limnophilus TaxID=1932778 RepID=A0A437MKX3_9SPHI|nr:Rieske (2Fe-2S) protein [Mucilaginibacter limnophilus]RVT98282.1 Rieske (2Fe-2S) protein [Mucilaginibacter limnophilus]